MLIFFIFFKGQEYQQIDSLLYKVKYRLTFQPDSTDVFSQKIEDFVLDRGKKLSLFYSENSFKRDSLQFAMEKNFSSLQMIDMRNTPRTMFNFRIIKNFEQKPYSIEFQGQIYKDNFMYNENTNYVWDISKTEKMVINNIPCNKATTNYGGRNFIAWFSEDIPIPDGPYKFSNLPGLIVKLYDEKKYYIFELISYKKSNKEEFIKLSNDRILSINTTKQKFDYAEKTSLSKNMNQAMINSGITLDQNSVKLLETKNKKKNNPIELKP